MLESCGKHPHERGVAVCRRCGGSWCGSCLVYAFGPKKPPLCLSCAMVAGGVRSSSATSAMPRRQVKARMKTMKAEAKAEAKAARAAARGEAAPAEEEQTPEPAETLADTDWSTPWWEDRQPTMAD